MPASASRAAPDGATAPLIQLERVVKRYPRAGGDAGRQKGNDAHAEADGAALDDVTVLHGVDLAVARGEFVALQGTSGSGKSTLLHIIGLLDRPSSGRYLLEGRDVAGLPDDEASAVRNRAIGFVFQSFYLVPYISALDNVLMPGLYSGRSRSALRARGEALLAMVGLQDRARHRPSQLSGGQQQRVALARALINEPSLLLADEPTGQLDAATSREIMTLISDIHQRGATVVLVTHDEATAEYASRRVLVEDGRIVGG